MVVRFGYDVVEMLYLEEATPKTTPTTGAWAHMGHPLSWDAKARYTWKKKVGLGNQIEQGRVKVKEITELTLAYELFALDASPLYQWTTFLSYILGETGEAADIPDEKHIESLSIEAKLDLATDEFWWIKGCKLNTLELRGNVLTNDPVIATVGVIGIVGGQTNGLIYGTTDPVSGSATRDAAPDGARILPSACDFKIATSSVYTKLSEWTFRINRNLIPRGRDATVKTAFNSLEEGELEVEVGVVMDFQDKDDLIDFLDMTASLINILIPSPATGRSIDLTGVTWKEHAVPKRELDLIGLTLTGNATDINISTIS